MVFAFAVFPPLGSVRAAVPYLAAFGATAAVVSCVWLSLGGAAGQFGEHFARYLPLGPPRLQLAFSRSSGSARPSPPSSSDCQSAPRSKWPTSGFIVEHCRGTAAASAMVRSRTFPYLHRRSHGRIPDAGDHALRFPLFTGVKRFFYVECCPSQVSSEAAQMKVK